MNSARPMEHLKRKYFILEENLYLLGWGQGNLFGCVSYIDCQMLIYPMVISLAGNRII